MNTTGSTYENVWVFMSEFSALGARGAPSAIFRSKEDAEKWIRRSELKGNLYKFPLDISLTEHCEPIWGRETSIMKHCDKSSVKYRSGINYLGYIEHEHYFD